jgi:hypothetical protein
MDFTDIKELSASRLAFLLKIEASVIGGEQSLHASLEYFFAVSETIPKLIKATKTKAAWELAVMTWGDKVDLKDFKKYSHHIQDDFDRIEAANVEPTDKSSGGKD